MDYSKLILYTIITVVSYTNSWDNIHCKDMSRFGSLVDQYIYNNEFALSGRPED